MGWDLDAVLILASVNCVVWLFEPVAFHWRTEMPGGPDVLGGAGCSS